MSKQAIGLGAVTTEHFRGKYISLAALQTAWPVAYDGDWAQVDSGSGSDVLHYDYDQEEGWVLSSGTPPITYVFTNGVQNDGSGNISIGGPIDVNTSLEVQPGTVFDLSGLDGVGVGGATISIAGSGVYGPDGMIRIGGNASGELLLTNTSFQFLDNRATPVGLEYVANYGATLGPRSIPDTEYTNSRLGGQLLAASPGASEDGYVYTWNNTNQEWDLSPNGGTVYTFGNGLTEIAGSVSLGGTASQNITINSDSSGTRTFAIGTATPFNSITIRASNVGNTARSNVALSSTLATLSRTNGANSFSISLSDTSGTITDQFSSGGLRNAADYSANFTDRNLIDYGFSTSHIGAQSIDALVKNPTASEDGFVIAWNNTNLEYELVASSGGGVTIGSAKQVPHSSGTDLAYKAGFEFDPATDILISPNVSASNSITTDKTVASTNSITPVFFAISRTSGTAATNIGTSIEFGVEADDGNQVTGSLAYSLSDVTNKYSRWSLGGVAAGAAADMFTVEWNNTISAEAFLLGSNSYPGVIRQLAARGSQATIDIQLSPKNGKTIIYGTVEAHNTAINNYTTLSQDGVVQTYTSASSFSFTASNGDASFVNGIKTIVSGGNAYTVSGSGNGGSVEIKTGQRRTAGSGIDGNMFLNYRNGNLALSDDLATDFQDGSKVIYIQDAIALPTANPANGVFIYPANGELYVYSETGSELSLSGRVTKVTESGAAVTLTQAHRGTTVKLTDNNPTVTLSDLGDDFQCTLLFTGTGTASFTGYTNLFSVGGVDQITDQYGMVYLYHETANNWYAKGDLV